MTPEELDVAAAFKKWASTHSRLYGQPINLDLLFDAYLAGARMAREQERERAKVLVKYVEIDTRSRGGFGEHARATLAEYRGEA